MSEKTKNKQSALKPPNSPAFQNAAEQVTPAHDPTDPKDIPFPEWSDEEINQMNNALPKAVSRMGEDDLTKNFEDPQVMFLPHCLQDQEYNWIRPQALFANFNVVMCTEKNEYPDLLNGSIHLMHSDFVRSFISSITILEYLSNTTNFPTECMTTKFTPNAVGPWKPWHHIYSGAKVGSGCSHNPTVNGTGKYMVRLFWMGTWRIVIIDDYLPIDAAGHILLPSLLIKDYPPLRSSPSNPNVTPEADTKQKTNKKTTPVPKPAKVDKVQQTVELWPFLLSKALLKVANLTMKKDQELVHFNIIHCLTGWVLQTIDVEDLSSDEIWDICKDYTKLYAWHSKEEASKQKPQSATEKKEKKKGKKKGKNKLLTPGVESVENSHYFIILCKDMRLLKNSSVQGISPCWGHEVIIDECRDLPLGEPATITEFPLWKTFRWIEWAKEKGMTEGIVSIDRTKYVKCVSPFKQFSKHKIHEQPDPNSREFNFPFYFNKETSHKIPIKSSKQEGKRPKSPKSPRSDTTKSSKSKERKKNLIHHVPPPDISIWVKFEDLCCNMSKLYVFFKPSAFQYKVKVSDLELNEVVKRGLSKSKSESKYDSDNKNINKNVIWTNMLQKTRNAPLYFFIDSLKDKMLLINLCQTGDVERLVPMDEEYSEDNFFLEYDIEFGEKFRADSNQPPPPKKLNINRSRIHASLRNSYLLFDRYRWDKMSTGTIEGFLATYGNNSTMVELEQGRHVFRVWINSESSFCMMILADTPFTVGSFEQILDRIVQEPLQITRFSMDICEAFGKLVHSYGSKNYSEYLRNYYRSYLPEGVEGKLTKFQKSLLHEAFQNSLVHFIEQQQDQPEFVQKSLTALRTIFLDLDIHYLRVDSQPREPLKRFDFRSVQERLLCEKSAVKMTAFLKGVQVRNIHIRHKSLSSKFLPIFESLKSIYFQIFSLEKRAECVGTIIRNFFNNEKVRDFISVYDLYKDLAWDVKVLTFFGSNELMKENDILFSGGFQCHSELPLCFHLFCNVPRYVLRIVDNDDAVEKYRYSNEILPTIYIPNQHGYTVSGYAWYEEPKTIHWKLVVILDKKNEQKFHFEEFKTNSSRVVDHYVPICRNLISKHNILLKENTIFSMRLSCSYENVKFNIRLTSPRGDLLVDGYGKQKYTLPAMLLRYERENASKGTRSMSSTRMSVSSGEPKKRFSVVKKKRESDGSAQFLDVESDKYVLEMYVVDNTWPLTLNEWKIVRKIREEGYYGEVIRSSKETTHSKQSLKTNSKKHLLKKSESIHEPWYMFQYAFRSNSDVLFMRNRQDEEELFDLKKSWYDVDPERYQKSFELREQYLDKYRQPSLNSIRSGSNSGNELREKSTSKNFHEEENVDSERTAKCPKWTKAEIPPFDLSPFYRPQCPCPLDFRRKYIKTEEDHAADKAELEKTVEQYNETISQGSKDLDLWMNENNERRTAVAMWYNNCHMESERIMQERYASRQAYINKWKEKQLLNKPQKKESKQGSGSKKSKK